jgi:outer membrane protein assembly factor BamA
MVTASELPPARANGEPRVAQRFVIDEGVQTRISDVTVTGATRLTSAEILGAMRLKRDGPYVAALVPADREAIRQKYDERGYGAAVIELRTKLSDDRTRVSVQVDVVNEGPQTLLDHVIIVGNRRVSEETIRAVVGLNPGQPLGMSARQALQQRLSAMGFFRRVSITEAPHRGEAGTDIVITVEESPTTTIVYGGGLEAGLRARTGDDGESTVNKFEMAGRASFEIGRTNLWGKNRSVNLNSGVSLRPKDAPGDPTEDGTCCGFSEYRVDGSFSEPSLFGWNAKGLISVAAEQAIRNSFNFTRQNGSIQMLRRLPGRSSFISGYSLERVRLSNVRIDAKDQLLVDRLFPQVRLSVLSSSVLRDTRNDPLSPGDGVLLSADANLAMRAIGSQVGFAKVFMQGFVYRRLENAPRIVLAGGARVGLVRGFAQTIDGVDVELVPASQRFFSGGSTTVRGFQQDRLGAPDILDGNGLSNGGNGLMVFNAEIRTALTKDLGIATFLDTGNVFARVGEMKIGDLRTSMGAGLRYRSPLGPLRFDIGWKMGSLRITDSRRWEFHFSIGEAF